MTPDLKPASKDGEHEVPRLYTPRLLLRPFMPRDIETVVLLAGDAHIARMTAVVPHPYTEKDARVWIAGQQQDFADGRGPTWAICDKASDQVFGSIGVVIKKRDQVGAIGYWLGRPFWRRGYTLEAAAAVVDWARRQGLPRLSADVLADNPGSRQILLRLGFVEEGILRHDALREGKRIDRCCYGLLLDASVDGEKQL